MAVSDSLSALLINKSGYKNIDFEEQRITANMENWAMNKGK